MKTSGAKSQKEGEFPQTKLEIRIGCKGLTFYLNGYPTKEVEVEFPDILKSQYLHIGLVSNTSEMFTTLPNNSNYGLQTKKYFNFQFEFLMPLGLDFVVSEKLKEWNDELLREALQRNVYSAFST